MEREARFIIWSGLRCVAVRCGALGCVAVSCGALRCVAVRCHPLAAWDGRQSSDFWFTAIPEPPGCTPPPCAWDLPLLRTQSGPNAGEMRQALVYRVPVPGCLPKGVPLGAPLGVRAPQGTPKGAPRGTPKWDYSWEVLNFPEIA